MTLKRAYGAYVLSPHHNHWQNKSGNGRKFEKLINCFDFQNFTIPNFALGQFFPRDIGPIIYEWKECLLDIWKYVNIIDQDNDWHFNPLWLLSRLIAGNIVQVDLCVGVTLAPFTNNEQ